MTVKVTQKSEPPFLLGAKRRSKLGHAVPTSIGIASRIKSGTASLLTRSPVAFRVPLTVMAGLVPAIGRGSPPLWMAGIKAGHDGEAGFGQGGSAIRPV